MADIFLSHSSAVNDAADTQLLYATESGGNWVLSDVVDNDGVSGEYCSIDVDSGDLPHISYHYLTDGPTVIEELSYASYNGVTWSNMTIDATEAPGYYSSLEIDSDDFARIGYYRAQLTSTSPWLATQLTGAPNNMGPAAIHELV